MLKKTAWCAAAAVLALGPAAHGQAVNDQTVVPARAAMTPNEQAILARLNVWLDKYDHDPKSMCEEIYAEDASVWVPNNGYWYRHRDTWTKYEIANHARRTGPPRNTRLRTAFVRDNIAVVEANGWAATLYFEPTTLRVFTDRTYIPGRADQPRAADLDALPLISAGSLPPVTPDKTALRYGAVEERDGMKLGHMRTRATGLKIFGAGSLTPEEARNVEAVRKLADLYNTAPDRMVDQAYAPGFQRILVKGGGGSITFKDAKAYKALQAGVRQAFPKARVQLITLVPRGDTVAYESVTDYTPTHQEWSLTIARLKNGRIVEEHVYESTALDPASPVGQLLKAASAPTLTRTAATTPS